MSKPVEAHSAEETVWKGCPSQVLNFWHFAVAVLLLGVIIAAALAVGKAWPLLIAFLPLMHMFWRWLVVRCERYELTTERLRLREGVLNRVIDDVELYRVKDTQINQPLWTRIFGLSNLTLITSDRSQPQVHFRAIRDGVGVRDQVRKYVEIQRDRKRTREIDFDGEGGTEFDMTDLS